MINFLYIEVKEEATLRLDWFPFRLMIITSETPNSTTCSSQPQTADYFCTSPASLRPKRDKYLHLARVCGCGTTQAHMVCENCVCVRNFLDLCALEQLLNKYFKTDF